MTPETFCEQFATFAEAPNGVAKLRELILQLAVQGKLGTQDVNDEPADVLLERARMECVNASDDGEAIDKGADSANECDDRRPEYPESWRLVQFADVISYGPRNGISPKPVEHVTKTKSLTLSATTSGTFDGRHVKYLTEEFPADSFLWLRDGDILIQRSNSEHYVGVAAIYRGESNDFVYPDLMMKVRIASCIDVAFAHLVLMSPPSRTYFRTRATGTSGSMRKINKTTVRSLPFPLPPLAEQRRIVGKVDQLLGLCDELAARQAARREARERLVGATLDRLVSARSAAEFPAHAHRLRDHFDRLFDTPTTLPQLRQAILQLAVQGQLVPQDPNDEPASVSLKRLREMRRKLIDAKEIKSVEFAAIADDEIEHHIPDSWSWSRLGEVCTLITDGTHLTPKYTATGRIFLSAQNVKPFCFQPDKHRFVSEVDYQDYIKSKKAEFEDVLLTRVGAGIGETAVIDQHLDFAFYVSLGLLRPFREGLNPYFLSLWLNSPIGRSHSRRKTYGKGVSQGNLNLNLIRGFVFPLPPLSEQKRIVSKVTELLSLCDALEAKLTQAESASTQLLSAAVHHLLNSTAHGDPCSCTT